VLCQSKKRIAVQTPSSFRYTVLADNLEARIRDGSFRAGDKLPSIRSLRLQTGLSISTVYQAYIELEKRGMVEPREKSGYYVKPLLQELLPAPRPPASRLVPKKVNINNMAFALIEAMGDPEILQLGGALVASELLPLKQLGAAIRSAPMTRLQDNLATYGHYLGHVDLRRQIARRMAPLCGGFDPERMVLTNGCLEAVVLGLKAVTRPGDTVLVESPTFPWFLQVIEDLNLHALEIPTDPHFGIDLTILERAIRQHAVKACIFIANFNNPLGYLMSDDAKRNLVDLLNTADVPIIEDDIYGELYFTPSRPLPLKAFDRKDGVLYCSSFSKCLSPGLRIGWIHPGRYLNQVKRLKINQSISEPALNQWLAARYLGAGQYDRHLRRLRTNLKNQVANTALAVARYFPPGTMISAPRGGLTLWVQMDARVDSLKLFRRCLENKIAVMPGIICANGDAYKNCIRLSCGMPYTDRIDQGLQTLAAIARQLIRQVGARKSTTNRIAGGLDFRS
jgi:DNA-binding transcriptional MocR family regulator